MSPRLQVSMLLEAGRPLTVLNWIGDALEHGSRGAASSGNISMLPDPLVFHEVLVSFPAVRLGGGLIGFVDLPQSLLLATFFRVADVQSALEISSTSASDSSWFPDEATEIRRRLRLSESIFCWFASLTDIARRLVERRSRDVGRKVMALGAQRCSPFDSRIFCPPACSWCIFPAATILQ